MDQYDPNQVPNPTEWLKLGEEARIGLVSAYHADADIEIPYQNVHAIIHVAVENQVALGEEAVPETLERLMRQGLARHEALHAIGAVLMDDIYGLLHSEQEKFNLHRYRNRLNKLTAKRWRKGNY